jgi:hypothetical protein
LNGEQKNSNHNIDGLLAAARLLSEKHPERAAFLYEQAVNTAEIFFGKKSPQTASTLMEQLEFFESRANRRANRSETRRIRTRIRHILDDLVVQAAPSKVVTQKQLRR